MKVNKPKIMTYEEKSFDDCLEDEEFSNVMISITPEKELLISELTFDSCIFKKIDFNNIKLQDIDLLDVIFENCDLSNQSFDKKFINRVTFNNCKLIGTTFIDAAIRDVSFINCNARYIN